MRNMEFDLKEDHAAVNPHVIVSGAIGGVL
jgi:hypothetical protein